MKLTPRIVAHAQGSDAWHQHRATHLNASELAVVMGLSPYRTRSELVRIRATGVEPEVDAMTARRFDQGHEFESIARQWAESMLDDALYPVVLAADVDGLPLSASLDGQVLDGSVIWEHKTGRADLLASLESGVIPEHYHPQLEQGLLLSGADRCLFMASNGDREAMRFAWYTSRPELRAQIVPAWRQFLADVQSYTPTQEAEPARAEPMESLPAVVVRLDGALSVAGNLEAFTDAARAFIARIPTRPATDNEFATCEAACKALKKAEEALDAAEAGALASISPVEVMQRMAANCRKLLRDARLFTEKLVDQEKRSRKEEAVAAARRELDKHIADLNGELAPMALRLQPVDFAGAIKGLRSFASMDDALSVAVANGKIAADAQARLIRGNLGAFKAATGDDRALQALFADLGVLVHKAADDFATLVDSRINKHRADEAERERKRQEAEAERVAEAERRAAAEAEARVRAEQAAAPATNAEKLATAQRIVDQVMANGNAAEVRADLQVLHDTAVQVASEATPAANEPATLKLGDINARLSPISVTAQGLNDLGIPAAGRDRAAVLFRESQFPLIVTALHNHLSCVLAQQGKKAA